MGKHSTITPSRQGQAERNVDWKALPPLCRPDDAEKKNREITELRQRSPSAEEPGDADIELSSGESFVDVGDEVDWALTPDSLSSSPVGLTPAPEEGPMP